MNTVTVVISLALLVTVASGLGYNSYNRYPSTRGNSWGSRGGSLFDNGGWNLGHRGGYGRKYSYSSALSCTSVCVISSSLVQTDSTNCLL